MKDEAHITVNPRREVLFTGAELIAEIDRLKAEIAYLRQRWSRASDLAEHNLAEREKLIAEVAKLKADANEASR